MKKLLKGIIDFRKNSIVEYRNKFSNLAFKQSPDTLLVACCDSRVVPNVFASSDPGDLFVLRNIGNLIPPYQPTTIQGPSVSATIEFALSCLKVSDIVICGHSDCGAMQSLINNSDDTRLPSLHKWLEYASPSYERFKKQKQNGFQSNTPCNCLSKINVLQQIDHLKTYPLVQERLQNKKLRIHGWWFDLETANVFYHNHLQKQFVIIDEQEAEKLLTQLR